MTQTNRRWVLAKRPSGEPAEDCFALEEVPIPELAEGEILVDVRWLSLDPYMRGRMRAERSYADPLGIGDVITGETAGIVAASRSARWSEGDAVCVHRGWQSHVVVAGDDPAVLPADTSLELQLWHEKAGYLKSVKFGGDKASTRGRVKTKFAAGDTDVGDIMVPAKLFK